MADNFNTRPYWDDYKAAGGGQENNYHRILFRPSFAVQARELTQLQSILQDQIERFGNHIFKDGSIVTGGGFVFYEIDYVKIENNFVDTSEVVVSDLIGKTVSNAAGVTALIVDAVDAADSDPKTMYIRYTNNDGGGSDTTFNDGEQLTVTDVGVVVSIGTSSVGKGSRFAIAPGVLYVNGFFVAFGQQEIYISKYSNTPTADVGFQVTTDFVTDEDDPLLLDPAEDSYNFTAPGAHRYQINLSLVVKTASNPISDFYKLLSVDNGVVTVRKDLPQYAEIRKEFARRTFDESGNYTVIPYKLTIRDHFDDGTNDGYFTDLEGGDPDLLRIGIEPGKSYVLGFENQHLTTQYVDIEKSSDTILLENQILSNSIGNYFIVNEVAGAWAVPTSGIVSLRNAYATAITSATYSSTAIPGTEIGTAKFRAIKYHSGTIGAATAQYRVYLYDVKITTGGVALTKSLVFGSGSTKSIADIVPDSIFVPPDEVVLAAVLKETSLGVPIYPLPSTSTRRLRDDIGQIETQFTFGQTFNTTFSAGSASISISAADETFPFGIGALTATEIQNNIIIVEDSGEIHPAVTATVNSSTSITVTIADTGVTTAKVICTVSRSNAREITKLLRKNRYVKLDAASVGVDGPYNLGIADVFRIVGVWKGSTYSESETDVTSQFTLDTGQRDSIYDHAKLIKSSSLTIGGTDKILVKLDYFAHDFSQGVGYYSVDSYPIDDTGATANTIKTWEIPVYRSPKTGNVYDLRNHVDFRIAKTNVSADATTIGAATENPAESETLAAPSGGLHIISPDGLFSFDMESYLARIDLVCIDADGVFVTSRGNPAQFPRTPNDLSNAMTIATVYIPPYPSLPANVAKLVNRPELGTTIRLRKNKRYTMRDIGALDNRISNLEYYVSLSQLEKSTNDMKILDADGLDRFKNGFLTDPFIDHSIGNRFNLDYKCAIDKRRGGLRPSFNINSVELTINTSESSNINIS